MRQGDHHVRTMRALIGTAKRENARMVAAAIGGHLTKLARETGHDPDVADASETVREASLSLLKALNRDADVATARKVALRSIETLEATIPIQVAVPRPAAVLGPELQAARDNRGILRRLASRRLPSMFHLRSGLTT
ncbi:MAG: hypothetical protein JWR08_2709 [Enterovirga sp.]|nr:hypothetical protein [Enterovirga sp.]